MPSNDYYAATPGQDLFRRGNILAQALNDDSNFTDDVPYTDEEYGEANSVTRPAGSAEDVQRIIQEKLSGIEITSPIGTPISPELTNDFEIKVVAGDSGLPFDAAFRIQGESDVQMTTKKRNQRAVIDQTFESGTEGTIRANLPPGSFTVTQVSSMDGYLLNGLHHDLQVGTVGYVIDGVYYDETPGIIVPKLARAYRIRIVGPDGEAGRSDYRIVGYANTYLGEADVELRLDVDSEGFAEFGLPAGHYSLIDTRNSDKVLADIDAQPAAPGMAAVEEMRVSVEYAPDAIAQGDTVDSGGMVISNGDMLEIYTPLG
ncbi:MAG: hypothetical protein LBS11_08640 [Oscillospiraceae bacterium]|jgi:hypothetical protein|nr:hypothetical protein [Oscillospiraceae bacterium]